MNINMSCINISLHEASGQFVKLVIVTLIQINIDVWLPYLENYRG